MPGYIRACIFLAKTSESECGLNPQACSRLYQGKREVKVPYCGWEFQGNNLVVFIFGCLQTPQG
jgi:hypothetical protein